MPTEEGPPGEPKDAGAAARGDAPRPSMWQRSSLHVKGLIVLAIPLLPLSAAMLMLVFQAHQDARADRRVTSIRQAHTAADDLVGAAVDAETGIRGYVATGNPVFLEPFDLVMADLDDLARAVDEADIPPEGQDLLATQYDLFLLLRERADSARPAELESLLLRAKENMDRVRATLGAVVERSEAQLDEALTARERLHSRTTGILWFGAISALLGGALGVLLFVREIARRIGVLQDNSRLLESSLPMAPVRGGDEIAALGRVLEETREELARKESLRADAEARMIQSRDEADRANMAKSEFLSRMSHELRTPLNAVLGFAQLLELDDLQPDQRESVRHIVRGGKHLLDLINEVLDISRIETGRLSLSLEPVEIRPLVEETLALTEPLAAAGTITVRSSFPRAPQATHVMGDQQRLKQIILNLVSNAIKYNAPHGSVDVRVSEEGDAVRLEVADTGPGLTEDQVRRLFTPFNRLGAEATDVEGTGLGLALSKRLAEAMGSDISVTSRPGQGSTFTLELRKSQPPTSTAVADDVPADAAPRAGVATILYIEDNAANLELVRSILARRPQTELVTALRGDEGIALARDRRPDVILLDLNLPDIQGGEVLQVLRADPRTASTPVIMLSADATPRRIETLKTAGAAAYLTKPLDVQRLFAVLEDLLDEAVA